MPMKAGRICSCGHQVASNAKCACQLAREAARQSSSDRGYNAKWQRESAAFLALPSNQFCACGCGRPADMVDHIVAHKGNMKLFWDKKNWQPMNRRCNSRKAAKYEGGFGNPRRESDL